MKTKHENIKFTISVANNVFGGGEATIALNLPPPVKIHLDSDILDEPTASRFQALAEKVHCSVLDLSEAHKNHGKFYATLGEFLSSNL